MPKFQTPKTPNLDHKDHIWAKTEDGYLCCLCGAVTAAPPPYPTPRDWLPIHFQKLTTADRALVPVEA